MGTRVLIPTGALGLGFDPEALAAGVAARPDIIAVDGGSTDSGPAYLGGGISKYGRAATRAEWGALMAARAEARCPLVVGTAGTCGTDTTVDWLYDITLEIARERGETLKIARLYSQQPNDRVLAARAAGRLIPLEGAPEAGDDDIAAMSNIVALAGAEQIGAALATGADIVIAGRATDTASIAALPLMRGAHPGAAWHAAKIGECGAYCTTRPATGTILVEIDDTGFTVTPMAAEAACTPRTVAAHMLYENADPYLLHEPGGHLDVTAARYTALDDRRVRVEGSVWVPSEAYTVKLEGARLTGWQTTSLVMLREPRYVANAQAWVDRLSGELQRQIAARMGLGAGDYTLDFRLIGVNATLGPLETGTAVPNEVGVLLVTTAGTQERATEIARLANPFLLHFALTDDEPAPTFAFPFSPADWPRGPVHAFGLHHVLVLDDPMAAFRLEVTEVSHAEAL
jgi:hypothetical protein